MYGNYLTFMALNQIKAIVDVVEARNSVVNVQDPVANVSVSVEAARLAFTTFSSAASLKAGLDLAKSVPSIRFAAVLGTIIAPQTLNVTAKKNYCYFFIFFRNKLL